MPKITLLSSLLVCFLFADTNLEVIEQTKPEASHTPKVKLTTRITPQKVKKSFRQDNHRYDKRYANFDYERNAYYDDEGYEYGYYDTSGYFYNNIFFTYGNGYTYRDRYHRRGHFRHNHLHRRHYVYHHVNDWNRVHCYREPNAMVRGHYYDRSYYPHRRYYQNNYRSNHYEYRRPARVNVTRMNGGHTHNRLIREHRHEHRVDRHREHNRNDIDRNNYNHYSNHNIYQNSRSNTSRNNIRRPQRRVNTTRMTTRNSSSSHSSVRHMGIFK